MVRRYCESPKRHLVKQECLPPESTTRAELLRRQTSTKNVAKLATEPITATEARNPGKELTDSEPDMAC